MPQNDLVGWLRAHILNQVHLRGVGAGDRLPGIREMARENGVDHRLVAEAYRSLEEEGLVEIRARSGVYAAAPGSTGADLPLDTDRWVAEVLAEARRRRIRLPDLPELLSESTTAVRLRCACVESNRDQMTAYQWELNTSYDLEATPVYVPPAASASRHPNALRNAVREAQMVFTTPFHAAEVAPIAEEFGRPLVVLRLDPKVTRDVESVLRRRLAEGPLTVIIADPRFADRLRSMVRGVLDEDRVRFVLADDAEAVARLDPSEAVVITRAARARLRCPLPSVFLHHSPRLSPETIREICMHIVQLNAQARRQGDGT